MLLITLFLVAFLMLFICTKLPKVSVKETSWWKDYFDYQLATREYIFLNIKDRSWFVMFTWLDGQCQLELWIYLQLLELCHIFATALHLEHRLIWPCHKRKTNRKKNVIRLLSWYFSILHFAKEGLLWPINCLSL